MKINKLTVFVVILFTLFMLNVRYNLRETFTISEGMSNMSSDINMVGTVSKETNAVSKSEIPPGKEDLYILKSQVVPPVCPKCPDVIQNCPKTECRPCKPCGRCPEPAFECKKVPNYSVINDNSLVRPNSMNPDMHGLPQ